MVKFANPDGINEMRDFSRGERRIIRRSKNMIIHRYKYFYTSLKRLQSFYRPFLYCRHVKFVLFYIYFYSPAVARFPSIFREFFREVATCPAYRIWQTPR